MTTSIPGNPYAMDPDLAETHDGRTTVAAVLALAYELRTATLVNVVRMYADLGMAEHTTGIIDAITNRLGGDDHE